MDSSIWRWSLGLSYIIAVATIWIAASYIIQSVVDAGVSPFLVTYICNSLFMVYLPIVEIARIFENSVKQIQLRHNQGLEDENLLQDQTIVFSGEVNSREGTDLRGRWTRARVAKVSILICPFWFLAQLTFNLSLKYTTITVRIPPSLIYIFIVSQ